MATRRKAIGSRKPQQEKQNDTPLHDVFHNSINSRTLIRKDTGLVFDRSMTEHSCLWDKNYPECPERFSKVLERCEELNLVNRCKMIQSRFATEEELLLKHDRQQIEFLKSTETIKDVVQLEELSSKYDAIFLHPSTYRQSLNAVGSTINLLSSICTGEIQNGMAIIRPPGHHAMKSEYCGYCFFNNVAIACEKMYENGEFWPNLRESDFDYVGTESGKGFNFNVPLNKIGMKDSDYIAIFQQILLPVAYEFQPDLVVVSAGYDAAVGCPEGEMEVTPACYSHLLSSILGLANGKVAVVMEGGYCLESLAEGAALTLRALLGDPCSRLLDLEEPSDSVCETILNVIYTHKRYWKCFQFQGSYSIHSILKDEESMKRHVPIISFRSPNIVSTKYETRNCYPMQSDEQIAEIKRKLSILKECTNLNKSQFKLCVAYDSRMLKHYDINNLHHPEKPSRVTSIYSKLQEFDVLKRCLLLQGRMATEDELLLAHSQEYMNTIKETSMAEENNVSSKVSSFKSVYVNSDTWTSARVATGCLLQVIDNVLSNKSQSGVAIIRPPGHHADKDSACGFCIFNNVAIAAKYAQKTYQLQRILIVDWDIHHGNGTQHIFEEDSNVLYISVHRYDNGSFFPSTDRGNYTVVGSGKGEGFNVNIPWNESGMSDTEYIAAFQRVVLPIAYQFNPDLILISAGFDACVGDPVGNCRVSPELYGHLTHWLSSLANGRIILLLEGGYNVNSISYAMTMCCKAILGDPLITLDPQETLRTSALTSLTNVLSTQKKYWSNLKFLISLPEEDVLSDSCQENLTSIRQNHQFSNSNTKLERNEREINQKKPNFSAEQLNFNQESESADENASCQSKLEHLSIHSELPQSIQALLDSEMFAVLPKRNCQHLTAVCEVPEINIDAQAPCEECNSISENWLCLKCYSIHCARNIKQHALMHAQDMNHSVALSFSDLSVWCYLCEAYIDSPVLYEARNFIHKCKFNEELPWTYSDFAID